MNEEKQASTTLQSIVGPDSSIVDFFEHVWQKQCKLYRHGAAAGAKANTTSTAQSPLENLIQNAWPALLSLLEEARGRFEDSNNNDTLVPILFSHGQSVSPDTYLNNLFHAYLDGCSVVINHADWSSLEIAQVCLDLQKSFPHVYANCYLTPPASQAVPPHADDRDVFVLQVLGKKQWKVYERVPIPVRYRLFCLVCMSCRGSTPCRFDSFHLTLDFLCSTRILMSKWERRV